MNTCEGYEDMISAFIDGMLSDRDRLALMEHMAHCSACQNYFNEQIAIHDAVMDDMESMQVPDGFAAAVMERVRTAPQAKKNRKIRVPHWRQWTALAACCVLAVLGAWRLGMNHSENTAGMQPSSRAVYGDTTENTADSGTSSMVTAGQADGAAEEEMEEPSFAVPEPAGMPKTAEQESKVRNGGGVSYSSSAAGGMETAAAPRAETPQTEKAETDTAEPEAPEASEPPPEPGIALFQDDITVNSEWKPDAAYAGILTTVSPLAEAWVEENLDGVWMIGESYELNAEEYQALKTVLSDNGAAFSETAGPAGSEGFLLAAAEAG